MEVMQVARSIARGLNLNEDLAEAIALGHDLGHTPFGHAGEYALGTCLPGGFRHNEQSVRVVEVVEKDGRGLNLTEEVRDGILKHSKLRESIAAEGWGIARTLEGQIVKIADSLAYLNHDIDDALRAGLITIADLDDVPLVGPMFRAVSEQYPGMEEARLVHESIRRLVDHMVRDLLDETGRRLAESGVRSVEEVRAAKRPLVGFSDRMRENDRQLKAFLFEHMYRHYKVNRVRSKARRVVRDLFRLFLDEPDCLPTEWRALAGAPGDAVTARVVADYIAGMTDRFALDEHRRMFDTDATI
jgi:dGTPase